MRLALVLSTHEFNGIVGAALVAPITQGGNLARVVGFAAPLVIIGKTLNHQSPQSTQVYARLDSDPVRQAMETAVSAMKTAANKNRNAKPS